MSSRNFKECCWELGGISVRIRVCLGRRKREEEVTENSLFLSSPLPLAVIQLL